MAGRSGDARIPEVTLMSSAAAATSAATVTADDRKRGTRHGAHGPAATPEDDATPPAITLAPKVRYTGRRRALSQFTRTGRAHNLRALRPVCNIFMDQPKGWLILCEVLGEVKAE